MGTVLDPPISCQLFYWDEKCKSRYDCKNGQCIIWDSPGVNPTANILEEMERRSSNFYHDVCMKIVLLSSCAPDQCGHEHITKYYKFSLYIGWPFVDKYTSIKITFNDFDSNCKPSPHLFGSP
jgi:hypothetical protein